jgi:hypothetical protein
MLHSTRTELLLAGQRYSEAYKIVTECDVSLKSLCKEKIHGEELNSKIRLDGLHHPALLRSFAVSA